MIEPVTRIVLDEYRTITLEPCQVEGMKVMALLVNGPWNRGEILERALLRANIHQRQGPVISVGQYKDTLVYAAWMPIGEADPMQLEHMAQELIRFANACMEP